VVACPAHVEAVRWASMRQQQATCSVCGDAASFHTRFPGTVVAPPGWRVLIGSFGARTIVCPLHNHHEED
jgi:hypothetical protein